MNLLMVRNTCKQLSYAVSRTAEPTHRSSLAALCLQFVVESLQILSITDKERGSCNGIRETPKAERVKGAAVASIQWS